MTGPGNLKQIWEERAANARLAEVRAQPAFRSAPAMTHALRRALAPILKNSGPSAGTLAARWPEIVGPRLSAITEPLRVVSAKGGATLHIRAPSAAAPMIQHAAEHIMERVGLASGSKIKAIKIVQTAPPPAPPKKIAASSRAMTGEERHGLTVQLASVQTPAVKLALERLGEAVLTWRGRENG